MKVYEPHRSIFMSYFHTYRLLDRYTFSGSPCACKPKMQHDLFNCVRDMHHGVFGIVKQIGSQRLRNYHHEREKAARKNIIEGPLTEEGL